MTIQRKPKTTAAAEDAFIQGAPDAKQTQAAEPAASNVPYKPAQWLRPAHTGVKPGDFAELYSAGATAIFPPGTVIADAAIGLLGKLADRLGYKL